MSRHEDELTPQEIAELGVLLLAERPRPSAAFAERLDARVAERFARPVAPRRVHQARRRSWLPAFAATAAVAVAALFVATQLGDPGRPGGTAGTIVKGASGSAAAAPGTATATPDAARAPDATGTAQDRSALAPASPRKVVQSASLALGAPADRIPGVAQDALGVVARFDGIVDQSTVSSGADGDGARFALRFPSARVQGALAELSRVPHARVLARTDDAQDVNQAFVSTRRRLATLRAEHDGLLRSLQAGGTPATLLQLRIRLDVVERTIAALERSQRALDRRIAYSRVALSVSADAAGTGGSARFTPGRALHDAGRVLAVTVGVVVIGASALVPLALLAACAWPLARTLRRRRREQALDAV